MVTTIFKILLTFVNNCGGKCALFTHNSPVFTFPVPAIDPIPTERFPEYVRDMLYGEENKLKAEFSVRYPYSDLFMDIF